MPRPCDSAAADQTAQSLHHLGRAPRLFADALADRLHVLAGRLAGALDQRATGVGVGRDRGQGLVDLVRDAGGQFAEDHQAVGVQKLLLESPDLLLGRAELGQVAHDADEARAVVLADLADRQVHREGGAVAAPAGHLAALADDAGVAGRKVIGDVPVVAAALGLGHQQGDVAPDDLLGAVAEHRFGGRVETGDDAARVDDDDRVGGRLHQGVQRRTAGFSHVRNPLRTRRGAAGR